MITRSICRYQALFPKQMITMTKTKQ